MKYKDVDPIQVLGYVWTKACRILDEGEDIRTYEVPKIISDFRKDFDIEDE